MIKLVKLLLKEEQSYGAENQYYDLGKDFSNFRRMIDGSTEELMKRYEKIISTKLTGKRVRAKASRGYKQNQKSYEFDVSKVSIEDYYDNYVIVAYDSTTPKPKEYFLKPGFKVQILGPATGQPSPQKGGPDKNDVENKDKFFQQQNKQVNPITPKSNPQKAQSQPMSLAPPGNTPTEQPVKEDKGYFDAYSTDSIANDIKSWIPDILLKPNTALRDFIKGLGWLKDLGRGTSVALFDLTIPANMIKPNINADTIKSLVMKSSKPGSTISTNYQVVKVEPNQEKGNWNIRIKKTMTDGSNN